MIHRRCSFNVLRIRIPNWSAWKNEWVTK